VERAAEFRRVDYEMDGNKLSDFGINDFGQFYTGVSGGTDTATDSAHSGAIHDFGSAVQKSISTQSAARIADYSASVELASDGSSFKVTWKSE